MKPCRVIHAALFCAGALLSTACFAADAKVSDADGREYKIRSARLDKTKSLDMNCGGTIVKHPFNSVKSMRVYPSKIKSIDGRLHYGIEVTLRDTLTAVGGGCFIPADNAVTGKSSKGTVTIPFEKLRRVYILGKEDKENAE